MLLSEKFIEQGSETSPLNLWTSYWSEHTQSYSSPLAASRKKEMVFPSENESMTGMENSEKHAQLC